MVEFFKDQRHLWILVFEFYIRDHFKVLISFFYYCKVGDIRWSLAILFLKRNVMNNFILTNTH